jgi:hypothetical protein
MSEPESFLQRWSRKKLEPSRPPAAQARDDTAAPAPAKRSDAHGARAAGKPEPVAPKPAFDIASLPSIESITAGSDVRAFLAPGVPPELTRAALRRAWVTDPAIRDFVGLAENAWDFNDPAAVPGFGELPPGTDIKKLLAQVFGETEPTGDALDAAGRPPAITSGSDGQATEIVAGSDSGNDRTAVPPVPSERLGNQPVADQDAAKASPEVAPVQRKRIAAAHQNIGEDESSSNSASRSHGGALPK